MTRAAVELSVVVPAFNEESRLQIALGEVESHLAAAGRRFELILSDDGSTDGSLQVMREAARVHHYIRVVSVRPNQGKGRAVARGVAHSSGELVLVSDTDFSTPISELPKLEAAIRGGGDVAIGSRGKRASQVELAQPPHRMLMGKTFNLVVQALLLPGLWDTQCGFKLFRGPVARELFGSLRTAGFAFDVEVLYRARRAGYRVEEVPVRWINSPSTRVAAVRHSSQMLRDVFRMRLGL